MSTTEEPIVDTSVITEQPHTEDAVIEDPITSEQEADEPSKTNEGEEEQDTATETPAKTPLSTKKRTIFNPFGKSTKKEEPEVVEPTSSTETPVKKGTTSKGFGTFFSRKTTPKTEEATDGEATVPTELPQIEQLQPIETDIHVDDNTVKETLTETADTIVHEATEVVVEVEQAANANAAKRQSFISKLFGKKKQDSTKEVEGEAVVTTGEPEESTDEEHKEETADEVTPVSSTSRPSSPLGRLTELFISKKGTKKATKATTTDEDKQDSTPEEEQVEIVVQDTSVAAPPAPVDASA